MKDKSFDQPTGSELKIPNTEMPALLIVEREPLICRYIKSIVFQMEMFRVYEAQDFTEASLILERETPMVLMIDIGLYPEEASFLIEQSRRPKIHLPFVIALSAAGNSLESNLAHRYGADYFLDKNFSHNELTGVLHNIKRQSDYLQKIAEKELHYRTIFDLSDEPLILIDSTSYAVLDINHAAQHLMGFKHGVDLPEDYSEILATQNPFQSIIRERITYASGIKIKKVNQRDFKATASFVYFDDQKMVLMSIKDLTEDMRQQDEKIAIEKLHRQGRTDTKEIIAFLSGEESERRRISREIHDHIGQMLVSIKLEIENSILLVKDASIETLLKNSRTNIINTISEVRALSAEMTTDFIPNKNLSVAIIELINKMQLRSYYNLELEIALADNELTPFMQSNIYRIAEESLTNIVKHGRDGKIAVRLLADANKLILSIERSGTDEMRPPSKGGLGIRIMQQRAALLGGSLEILAISGKQFKVELQVPL